jgi:DNA-binding transcriptional LysR family regulator
MIGKVSDIDLRLLRVFVAIVESGGFSLATARLNVSESTVSSHMSDLEKRLGLRLCERGRAGFRLTADGEQVYEAAVGLLERLDDFRDRLATLTQHPGGTLRVGVPDGVYGSDSLPVTRWLGRMAAEAPEILLDLQCLEPRTLERKVSDEELHLALGPEHRRIAGLDYVALAPEVNLLCCGAGHPLFGRDDAGITRDELQCSGLISRGYLESFDADFFEAEAHRATVHHIEAALLLIATGRFVGFLPEHVAAPEIAAGRLRALKPDEIRLVVPFSMITKRSRTNDPRVQRLRKIIEADLAPRRRAG